MEERLERLQAAQEIVVSDPEILSGTPVNRGSRIPVYDIAASVASGNPVERILAAYPSLKRKQVELASLYVEANPQRGRSRLKTSLAILISFSGVAIIALASGGAMRLNIGALLIVAAAACAATQFYLQKPLLVRYSALSVTAYLVWAGTIMLIPWFPSAFAALPHAANPDLGAAVFVGVFPAAVAYGTWSLVLKNLALGRAVGFLYLIPPVALLFSYLWLHEVPSLVSLAGGSLALCGVVMLNQFGRG